MAQREREKRKEERVNRKKIKKINTDNRHGQRTRIGARRMEL
jgi:hypothetical protein